MRFLNCTSTRPCSLLVANISQQCKREGVWRNVQAAKILAFLPPPYLLNECSFSIITAYPGVTSQLPERQPQFHDEDRKSRSFRRRNHGGANRRAPRQRPRPYPFA